MFTAGVTNNFVVGTLCIVLLFGPVAGSIAVADGYPVGGTLGGGPADQAGLEAGDVITSVDGAAVTEPQDLGSVLADTEASEVTVSLRDGGEVTVTRRLVVSGSPREGPLPPNSTVTAVNGTAVHTVTGFREAVQDRRVARLETSHGEVTLPMGALVRVTEGGPLAAEGAPVGESIVVTAVDDQRVVTSQQLADAVAAAGPGSSVRIEAYAEGSQTYQVTLAEGATDAGSALGARFGQTGTTGLTFTDFGVDAYSAGYFLDLLGGDADRETGAPGGLGIRLLLFLFMPFLGLFPGFSAGFTGFVGVATNFFTATGPLAVLGAGGVFALANVLFWTAWVNIIVGQFNLIPAFPLDGGHILRASTESIVARLPVSRKRALTRVVTVSIGLMMLAGILLGFFGPGLTS